MTFWSEGFRQRLDLIREERGISKAEMARLCGLPPRTLENYFKGHKPGIDALMALSIGLDVSVDWLLGDEEWHRNRPRGHSFASGLAGGARVSL